MVFSFAVLFLSCDVKSEELRAILNNSAANMSLITAKAVERSYNDKSKTFGKPINARVKIIYEPMIPYSKNNAFNEIIKNLKNYGWKEDWRRYSKDKQRGYFTAYLPYESILLFAEVLYTKDFNTVSITIEQRTQNEKTVKSQIKQGE